MKEFYKIFTKLIIVLLVVFIADRLFGGLIQKIYFNQKEISQYFKITYSIEKMDAPIVIFGSSRAYHHYISNEFQKEFNMPSYNVGRGGNFMFYQEALLKSILKRYTPDIIILDILPNEFSDKGNIDYDRLSVLLPYYKKHPEIRSIVNLKSPFEKYKSYSETYRFNSLLLPSISGWLDIHKRSQRDTLQGFLPLHGSLKMELKENKSTQPDILDTNKVNAFKTFITLCKQKGIEVYVFISPSYSLNEETNTTVKFASDFTRNAGYYFQSYLEDTTFLNNNSLFKDQLHLNIDGAELYTKKVIQTIKSHRAAKQ